jgi:hypothetical protein
VENRTPLIVEIDKLSGAFFPRYLARRRHGFENFRSTELTPLQGVEGNAELFRKKVDAAQPSQSILAELQEHGLIVSGQRGKFTDLSGTERKAFILSIRSAGAEATGSERQADLYFLEP